MGLNMTYSQVTNILHFEQMMKREVRSIKKSFVKPNKFIQSPNINLEPRLCSSLETCISEFNSPSNEKCYRSCSTVDAIHNPALQVTYPSSLPPADATPVKHNPALQVTYSSSLPPADTRSSKHNQALGVVCLTPPFAVKARSTQHDAAVRAMNSKLQRPVDIHLAQSAKPLDQQFSDLSFHSRTATVNSQRLSRLPSVMRKSSAVLHASMLDLNLDDIEGYDPYEHRHVAHPTTDCETLIHLMKGSFGTGILAMPGAFKSAGLFFGLFGTFAIGCICTYAIHILVKSSRKMCRKMKVTSLGYDDLAEVAFFAGPPKAKKFAKLVRFFVNFFLVLDLIGCCCVYVVFVGSNLKKVMDVHLHKEVDLRIYMACLLPFLIAMNLVPHLKFLAPFSLVANCLMAGGMLLAFYEILHGLPPVTSRPVFSSLDKLPLFFGTAIFALEGIGVVLPLENNMKNPEHFIGFPGVLYIGMFLVVLLYSSIGFFGYLRYGEATSASITLNLSNHMVSQAIQIMIAVAIFLTYTLQFYVPLGIIWKAISEDRMTKNLLLWESVLRIVLVTMTVGLAILCPHLGPFLSLVGAVCLSFLGLIFPAMIEIVVFWDEGLGKAKWMLWKNLAIILFGMVGFLTGSYSSILDILKEDHVKL